MEGRPRTALSSTRVLDESRSSGECQRFKSDINISLSVCHSSLIINFPRENLLSYSFSLTVLSITILIVLNYLYLSLSSALCLRCGHKVRVHLSIGCPHYRISLSVLA